MHGTGGSGVARLWGQVKSLVKCSGGGGNANPGRAAHATQLKATLSNQSRINVMLWYRLVG